MKAKKKAKKWTAAQRKAHGAKIAATKRKNAKKRGVRHAMNWLTGADSSATTTPSNGSIREQIRAAVRAELPAIVDEELRELLGQ